MAGDPQRTASPVCFLHELGPTPPAASPRSIPSSGATSRRWRRAERERLIAARLALDPITRASLVARIVGQLDALLGDLRGQMVSAWLPFRGEPDLRPWMAAAAARGATTALPVAEARGQPLRFRTWRPGEALAPGSWNIAVPAGGAMVTPDLVLAPVVGFDGEGFRLGYGGGFFDRTLAALTPRPRAVGVGFAAARLATIFPQPHDVPMDMVVTEEGCAVRRSP